VETYIVRIYRRVEKGDCAFAGLVENAETGGKRKFADSGELLKILKLPQAASGKPGEIGGARPRTKLRRP
jgi:hypothetical protein